MKEIPKSLIFKCEERYIDTQGKVEERKEQNVENKGYIMKEKL